MKKNNCRNSKVDLCELLKHIEKSICSISQTINYKKTCAQKTGKHEQSMLEYYYEVLRSLSSVLTYSHLYAENKNEIHYLRQIQDLIEQGCAEFEYNRTNKQSR